MLTAAPPRALYVSECFGPTLQGEGPTAGTPALFVRLGGCNLACTWCDTPYTWDARRYRLRQEIRPQAVADVLAWITAQPRTPLVVLTGGEPLLQADALGALVPALLRTGRAVEVETNGTRPPPPWADGRVAWNVSPKLATSGNAAGRRRLHRGWVDVPTARFKFVCTDAADVWAVEHLVLAYGLAPARVWLMPEGQDSARLHAGLRWLAPLAIAHGYHLSDRLHVHLWGATRGH